MPTGAKRGIDAQFFRLEVQFAEAMGRDLCRLPVVDVDERLAPPEGERFVGRIHGPLRLAEGEQLTGPAQLVLEPARVEIVVCQGEPVAERVRLDRFRPQRPPEPHDAALHDLVPRRRHLVAPQGASARRAPPTTSRHSNASALSTIRSRGPREPSTDSVVSGPRTDTRTGAVFALVSRLSKALIPH